VIDTENVAAEEAVFAPLISFTMDRTALKEGLEVVNLTTTKEAGAVTSIILFEVHPEDGKVLLKSSNRRAFTCAPVALKGAVGNGERAFTADAKSLLQWLSAVDGETVEVSDLQQDGVRFGCGKIHSYMRSLDASSFPDQTSNLRAAQEELVSCVAEQLAAGFAFVRPFLAQPGAATSTKESLQITHWSGDRVTGTDSKVMGLYRSTSVKNADIKIHFQEVQGLVSFLRKFASQNVRVVRNNQIVFAVTEEGAFYGFAEPTVEPIKLPLIDLGPESEELVISLPPSEVARAVRAVSATAEARDVYLSLELRPIEKLRIFEPAPFLDEETAAAAQSAKEDMEDAAAPTHELVFRMRDASEKHDNEAAVPVKVHKAGSGMESVYFNHESLTSCLAQFSSDGVLLCFNLKSNYIKMTDAGADYERCCLLTMLKAPASRAAAA
jgi:hypothetical protein